MDGPRDFILSSQTQTSYDIIYMWTLKKNDTNELIYKTEIDSQTWKTNLWLPTGKGERINKKENEKEMGNDHKRKKMSHEEMWSDIIQFSKFAGILSAALSQHHLLRFEIAQLEFHHLH